ncbi:hypothetical protein AB0I81_22840 [Nonomuraea sp. NPDC050404]|uniref:hypothetical protein n=1 Tax=Nonomuraea sp. NPDC050404 TaxID=3155783 RepID=UPI0033CDF7F2
MVTDPNARVFTPWPHEPTDACTLVHCHTHNVDEPEYDAYRVCGECSHVFPTAAALLADQAALVKRLNANPIADPRSPDAPPVLMEAATDPDTIWSCPHCAHDF